MATHEFYANTGPEQAVRASHATVAAAKEAYTAAHTQQAASQKEVVGLLERKQSWSAPDLERYMSLIRSEHLNEQAVQRASDELAAAEKTLEEARSELEKKERKQYHEEQIWSDTIRRNSTWVTFGLMGVNILLLLVSIVVFEPWRRKRLVREFRTALEEKSISSTSSTAAVAEVDKVTEPSATHLEAEETGKTAAEMVLEKIMPTPMPEEETVGEAPLASGEILPKKAVDWSEETQSALNAEGSIFDRIVKDPGSWDAYQQTFQDLFSEQNVMLKKVDVTTIALEGAATGVAIMGLLFVLLRPR